MITILLLCIAALIWIGHRITLKHPIVGSAILMLTGGLISALLRHFGIFPSK